MAGRLKLTIALERYDRHFPFFDRTVTPPENVEFDVLQVGQSVTLRDGTAATSACSTTRSSTSANSPCRPS